MVFGKRSSSSSVPSSSKFSSFLSGIKDGSAFQLQLKDRVSAGKVLAMILKTAAIKRKKDETLTVLGIPRGGVIVADVVAEKLNADYFDIVIPRKLRAPDNKENAIGAIAPDGSTMHLDEFMIDSLKVSSEYIETEKAEQREEIKRRTALYKRPLTTSSNEIEKEADIQEDYLPITTEKTTVLLIDDGIATGATVITAARWLRNKYKPAKLIIAAPVASKQAIELIKNEGVADMVETVTTPANFVSVSQFYKDFDQATDDKVIEIVNKWRRQNKTK
ncbi:MAG TPA: phosphoribosyltransferase family protein [Nitrososphaera sp.]|nr:phosphoribosyltransferase family protein [Nitrososphaera sp.]